jgi:hypothetical protein
LDGDVASRFDLQCRDWHATQSVVGFEADVREVPVEAARGSCPTLKVLQLDNLSAAYPPDFSREDFQDGECRALDNDSVRLCRVHQVLVR